MKKKEKFSVLTKLFVIYSLVIVFIYICLVGIIINHLNQTTNRLIESKKEQTSHFLVNLEQMLDVIYNHEIGLTNSGNTTKIAYKFYKDEYEKSRLILEQIITIQNIQALSPIIENIIITYPLEQITLSSKDGYNKGIKSGWKHIKKGAEYNYFIEYEDHIVMNFTYPLMYSESKDYVPNFNIQILLSNDYLSESLNSFIDDRGSGASIVFTLPNNFIIESDHGSILKMIYNKKKVKHNSGSGYELINSNSMKYPLQIVSFIDRQVIDDIKLKYIIMLTVIMIIITFVYVFSLVYTKNIVIKPLKELMSAFDKIQNGDFTVRIFHEPNDEFNYLYKGFNRSVSHIEELIANIYKQESLIQNAELAQLQSQINPHFLFNSFFIINRMAKNESYELITKFVTSLACYYRFINKKTKDFIPLSEEIEHMNNYIEVQQMRFGDKIFVNKESISNEIKDFLVPKLILQPLIENAYNYGLANKLENGLIKISYKMKDSLIKIYIEDNGEDVNENLISSMTETLKYTHKGENHALNNIHRRLKLAFGEFSGIMVDKSSLGGIRVILNIYVKN